MDPIEIIGLIAATLTTSAFVPQVVKTWKTKSTKDISLTMYSAFFLGTMLWLYYGYEHQSLAIMLANGITGILVIFMLVLKIRHK
ncbi:SemiSWEET transporter [Muricauda sp. 2012CJ35-5]|uniref:SemiSWEET transporter n=1 Tax=Flagellimonas spongiicola TaxID=2942208 RepID=A0ABT0PRD2_9FLAO|nr:SemiSWEET transporter [Allomuricauda spongiicola]MCL6273950.1 SemiSWEET transporter [Allomuricauda spongiicola]